MKYIFTALIALSFAACSPSKSENKTPASGMGGSTGQSNAPVENKTDYNSCGNFTSNRDDIDGTWQMQQAQGEFSFLFSLTFNRGTVTATNDCSLHNHYLRAEASTYASYGNGRLRILSGANKTENLDDGDFHMDCSVSIAETSMNYSFRGNCLVLTQPGQSGELVLVPR